MNYVYQLKVIKPLNLYLHSLGQNPPLKIYCQQRSTNGVALELIKVTLFFHASQPISFTENNEQKNKYDGIKPGQTRQLIILLQYCIQGLKRKR